MTTQAQRELAERVLKCFKPPFTYDKEGGYFFDSENQMVAEVRAWGHLQHFEKPEELQDALGEWICETMNSALAERSRYIALEEENKGLKLELEGVKLPADIEQCPVCKWTNTGYFLNVGGTEEGKVTSTSKWMCHGCIKKAVDQLSEAKGKAELWDILESEWAHKEISGIGVAPYWIEVGLGQVISLNSLEEIVSKLTRLKGER